MRRAQDSRPCYTYKVIFNVQADFVLKSSIIDMSEGPGGGGFAS